MKNRSGLIEIGKYQSKLYCLVILVILLMVLQFIIVPYREFLRRFWSWSGTTAALSDVRNDNRGLSRYRSLRTRVCRGDLRSGSCLLYFQVFYILFS